VGDDVKTILPTKDGILWVGTGEGISELKWSAGAERPVFRNLTRAQGLSDNWVNALAQG
jgi:hypothetical protein